MAHNNTYIANMLGTFISPMELEAAAAQADRNAVHIFSVLEQNGYSPAELLAELAKACGLEYIELTESFPPCTAANIFTEETARKYGLLPLEQTKSGLKAAFGDPTDLETMDTVSYLFDQPVELVIAQPEQIERAIARIYTAKQPNESVPPSTADRAIAFEAKLEIEEGDEPIIKLVNLLIVEAFKQRSSDIHLEPMAETFRIRYRIDGALREVDGPPMRLHPTVISRIKIMAGMLISEKRLPQDGRIEIQAEGRMLDLRVSSIPTNHGESIVMRILDKENLNLGLPNLGFLQQDQDIFNRWIQYPDGIVLITGPTGSGKTTSLYACLNHLNQPERKIITVEDPVEYQLTGINQVHVRADIGLTFSAALRSMLRQAPNVIMIGEIRDQETAEIAVNAALTGHLVLSTLHTNDAPSAVSRLADIGIKPFLLSSSVRGIMAQRLVRTICPECKVSYEPTKTDQQLVGHISKLYRGDGCPTCAHTGYYGRKGIFELLTVNDELREMIYSGATTTDLRATARESGMHSLREDGFRKAADGLTTLNEVLRVTMKDEN